MRKDWDIYFMDIAKQVATRATCDRKHVGAVVVRDRNILATGYNGSLPGQEHCDNVGHMMEEGHCVRTNHAEANAICQAAKNGVRLEGSTIYVTASPCWPCFKLIASTGIKRIVFGELYRDQRITKFAEDSKIDLLWLKDHRAKMILGDPTDEALKELGCESIRLHDHIVYSVPEGKAKEVLDIIARVFDREFLHKTDTFRPSRGSTNPSGEIPLGDPQPMALGQPYRMSHTIQASSADVTLEKVVPVECPDCGGTGWGPDSCCRPQKCHCQEEKKAVAPKKPPESSESTRWVSPMQMCKCGHVRDEHKEIYSGHCDGVHMTGSGCDTEFDGCSCKKFEFGDSQDPICFGESFDPKGRSCVKCGFADRCWVKQRKNEKKESR